MKDKAITKFLDSAAWAMEPTRLDVLLSVVADHIAGNDVKLAATDVDDSYKQVGEVALVPIVGTIKKRAYGLEAMSGARTTVDIQNDIQSALDNPKISAIVLDIDSPGGTVDGTKELADFIKASTKPVVAYANGLMASAAMWLGSAADYIVGYDTANIGSIGVVVRHQDWSAAEEEAGLKTTYIYAGKYKAMGNSSEPLTKESREYIQSKIDKLYTMFVNDIASNRNLSVEYVLENLATADTFLGQEALDLKLIDSVGTIQDAIAHAKQLGGNEMTEEQKAQFEAMQAQLEEANSKLTELASTAEAAQAAKEELEQRIEADKHEAAIKSLFSKAKVSDEFVSTMCSVDVKVATVVADELVAKQASLDDLLADHEEPTKDATTEHAEPETVDSIDSAVEFIMSRDKCDIEEATDKVAAEFPELFTK